MSTPIFYPRESFFHTPQTPACPEHDPRRIYPRGESPPQSRDIDPARALGYNVRGTGAHERAQARARTCERTRADTGAHEPERAHTRAHTGTYGHICAYAPRVHGRTWAHERAGERVHAPPDGRTERGTRNDGTKNEERRKPRPPSSPPPRPLGALGRRRSGALWDARIMNDTRYTIRQKPPPVKGIRTGCVYISVPKRVFLATLRTSPLSPNTASAMYLRYSPSHRPLACIFF